MTEETDTDPVIVEADQHERLAHGAAVIAKYVALLPNSPGVYRMVGANDAVLYVGKASNLKKRVNAYTKPYEQPMRIARMISQTLSMEFVQTASEVEALLLEANLIKRLRPRFNILLRDDKSFPHILVTGDHRCPQIVKHRGSKSRKGTYFGPFASAGAVNRTLNILQRAFLLRSCSDSVFESRTRPCLLYQIKRCAGPCVGKIQESDYAKLVDQARDFLSGKSSDVKSDITQAMERAAEGLDFERAATLRDRVRALAHIQLQQGINLDSIAEADLFAIHGAGGHSCVQVVFFRSGQNWGNHVFFPKHEKGEELEHILQGFVAQFYDEREPPRLILLSHDVPERELLAEALTQKNSGVVEVAVPQRGEKREALQHALVNAKDALARRMADGTAQRSMLAEVAAAFGLRAPPERIEIYDNSHIQGAHAVGAMVVAGADGFQKGEYRKFNIKNSALTPGDDFGMMKEVLSRRFKRLADHVPKETDGGVKFVDEESDDTKENTIPDLIIIDGGEGQLTVARKVLCETGFEDLSVLSIAKGFDRNAGRERFFVGNGEEVRIEPKSSVIFFLQRLRDEAHRFAIGTHRAKRSKAFTASPLDEIQGIGPSRKRALLNHFGSGRAVTRAGLADLEAVSGISKELARKIYEHFHEKP